MRTKYKYQIEGSPGLLSIDHAILHQTYEPLWSDGSLDGSYIPKMVASIPNAPEGKIFLTDGTVIYFSVYEIRSDNTIIIKQPYHITEAAM